MNHCERSLLLFLLCLYWTPNACTDTEGRFTATFYNNAKETRIKISAAGVTSDGRLLHSSF